VQDARISLSFGYLNDEGVGSHQRVERHPSKANSRRYDEDKKK
jgi:hypothetical protein